MSVDAAYAEVERITRREARNFAYGIRVLPRDRRRAISAIYAFARRVDDIADGTLPVDEKRARLEELHDALEVEPADAMLVALGDARIRYSIPDRSLHDLVDGGLKDTEQDRYPTFAELHEYCRHVAGAVGVACVAVYGSEDVEHAETLGVALQLINIMRDVREDWELGRVYLPQDELGAYGVSEDDVAAGRVGDEWRALMAFQASRARAYLDEGLELLDSLDSRSAACVSTFAGLYGATLDRIEARGYDVFDGSLRLSPLTKLRIVGAGLLR
ncbi:MAG TPA: squalene/phytoene synthase family protein [Gaiellaceae bacterium]|jgi:phytoene synthase